ncbi:MAG: gliding motility-associated C-terminal domain-containing protein [Bacteroidia bacterium]|nr:gliding motility-associated C-terminal domain-containing protein [Bacteroidia bacterium]
MATNALNKTYAWGGSEFIASKSKDTIRYFNSAIPKILHNSTAEITKISLGKYHSVLLKSDGRISVSGRNNYHQLGLADTTPVTRFIELQDDNWIDCDAGAYHTIALKSNGTIWTWGNNFFGQLGDTFNSIVPKILKTSVLWRDISVGYDHNLAIDENGKLWAWGKNNKGQLGVGDTIKRTQPLPISTDRNWRFIDAGPQYNFAIKSNGTLWGWGNNDSGQLGIGNNIAAYSPVKINNDSNWIQISCGLNFTIGLKANGSLWSWGSNNSGQLGFKSNGTILTPKKIGKDNDWVAVECGTKHVIALKSNGTVWTWGDNSEGQLANYNDSSEFKPKQLNDQSNIIQISAGSDQSGIIKSDRSMVCLAGANHFGQLADGSKLSHNFFGCIGDSIQIKILKSNNNNYCNGSRITVPFAVNKTLSNNNNFVLLLSDSNGNFSNPTILSNKASNTSDTFFVTIPATINESNKYRLKIVSTSPVSYSMEDTNNIYIHRYSTTNKIITPRNTIYCNQDSVVLQIPNKYLNISWNSKHITNIISVRKSGTFKVQAYDSSNCLIIDSVAVFFSNPSLDLGIDTLENPNCKIPDFNFTVDSGWSKYEWSNNDTTYKTVLKSEGLYTLRVTDTVGCQSKDSLYFKNRTDSFFSNITIKNLSCFEDKTGSINLETKGGQPPYNYIWNDSARKNNVAKNLQAGTYNCIVLDSKGCADTLENLVVIQPKKLKLLLKESGLTNCKDTASGYILCTTTGGHSPYSYQWNSAGTDTTESIANLRPGTYLGVVRDSNLCLDSLQISIEQANSPKINLEHIDSITCFGKKDASIRIRISGGQKPIKNYFNNTLTQDTSFLNLGPSNYFIRVIDNAGCVDSLMIKLPEADSLSVHIVQPCYFLNNTPFRPVIESKGKINSWEWSPFELFGSSRNNMDPLIYPNQNQWIYVNVMNNKGCISSDSAFLYRAPALKDVIPNAFTPNNDNINDVFGPHSLYQISKLKILSRWGEIIYQGNLEGWNGFYQSALVGPGIYIYEIEANLQGSDKSQKATGTFLLLH